jgi:hypothetical protein
MPTVEPLPTPINDLIALRPEGTYIAYLETSYKWPQAWNDEIADRYPSQEALEANYGVALLELIGEQAGRWRRRRLPDLFLAAAERATQGHLSARVAAHLERVHYRPEPEPDEVPDGDVPALAAWALNEALRLRPLKLFTCPLCQSPWLGTPEQDNPYCLRPAPRVHTPCRTLERNRRFREERGDWRREYKRLHERRRRGTLSEQDWEAWTRENAPSHWAPFETWRKTRKPD